MSFLQEEEEPQYYDETTDPYSDWSLTNMACEMWWMYRMQGIDYPAPWENIEFWKYLWPPEDDTITKRKSNFEYDSTDESDNDYEQHDTNNTIYCEEDEDGGCGKGGLDDGIGVGKDIEE